MTEQNLSETNDDAVERELKRLLKMIDAAISRLPATESVPQVSTWVRVETSPLESKY